jgi:hypothetical protein
MEKEKSCLEQLQSEYGNCQRCGPVKTCKITIAGDHHHLSNNQLLGWAHSLVCFSSRLILSLIFFLGGQDTRGYVENATP